MPTSLLLAFFGMPGHMELLIFGTIVAVIVFAVVTALRAGRRPSDNPNLTPCPDCDQMISIRATTCPHCGCPLTPPKPQ